MKTLGEFIKEIEASKELQKELKNVENKEAAEVFLKKHDCGATAKELAEFIKSQVKDIQGGELSDDEASSVAGGVYFMIDGKSTWFVDVVDDGELIDITADYPSMDFPLPDPFGKDF